MTTVIPSGPLADALARLPLVPRKRALALPMNDRIKRLTTLAASAEKTGNLIDASGVHNLTALLAADRGLPDLARTLCHNHAALYLARRPLTAEQACLALEPLVNLAHLLTRSGDGEAALDLLEQLAHAVATDRDATLDGIPVPLAGLTATNKARGHVAEWLDNIVLYDGARALVRARRWVDAYLHLKAADGARRMFDSRQIGAVAMATQGHVDLALEVLSGAPTEKPWEEVVASTLAVACMLIANRPCAEQADGMLTGHRALALHGEMPIFDVRLALSVADLATAAGYADQGRRIFSDTAARILEIPEGYSAHDLLAHPRAQDLAHAERDQLAAVVAAAGLGIGRLSIDLEDRISAANMLATQVISRTLRRGEVA
ncbi:hypothetical protein [Kitasatospora sp. NPDC094015]|uniref:hypothetical protein n=1 Tax=Kitasatospora sp. NPDC094015 TaxID=3155205 RepID=UPI003324E137